MNRVDSILSNCSGCECCLNVCPKGAIFFDFDKEGFLYPIIDNQKCINCGLCFNNCPQNKVYKPKTQHFYGFSKWGDSVSCASGGISSYLSQRFIEKGGYVCGCIFDDSFLTKHILSNKFEDLEKMKSSKYLQSRLGDCYPLIKNKLDLNVPVLFIGTPCQVAGLKSFLKKDYNHFYTIDLICHGIPSPLLFQNYKKWLEKNYRSSLKYYNFRFKKDGVMGHTVKYTFQNNKSVVLPREFDKYDLDYKKRNNYRKSCYDCPYSNLASRVADLSVGDFWGLAQDNSNYDKRGVSSVISNSEKGEELIKMIEPIYLFGATKEDILNKQDALNGAFIKPIERESYYSNFDADFFKRKKSPKNLKFYFKKIIPNGLKTFLKKILRRKQMLISLY